MYTSLLEKDIVTEDTLAQSICTSLKLSLFSSKWEDGISTVWRTALTYFRKRPVIVVECEERFSSVQLQTLLIIWKRWGMTRGHSGIAPSAFVLQLNID